MTLVGCVGGLIIKIFLEMFVFMALLSFYLGNISVFCLWDVVTGEDDDADTHDGKEPKQSVLGNNFLHLRHDVSSENQFKLG